MYHYISTGSAGNSLQRLTLALNKADYIEDMLSNQLFPQLQYLNLRKTTISAEVVGKIGGHIGVGGISTLVLDGIKLAGSTDTEKLLGDISKVFRL